jgi:FdhD protein
MSARAAAAVVPVHRVRADGELASAGEQTDEVAAEEPLEVRLAGETFATTMRTPGHDHELVAGLLFGEGLIGSRAELGSIVHCGRPGEEGHGNVIDVAPGPGFAFDLERVAGAARRSVTSAACGVCGRRTIDDLLDRIGVIESPRAIAAAAIRGLPERLRAAQPTFDRTGGLHAAGIADADGELAIVREDIGRHNAVDKAIGRLLLDGRLPAGPELLVVSGRVSFEIVQKALAARIGVLVAVSAPSSLAVRTAERANMTLIGFARAGGFVVYAGFDRLT